LELETWNLKRRKTKNEGRKTKKVIVIVIVIVETLNINLLNFYKNVTFVQDGEKRQ
jgi:hypothetical protein